LQVIFASSVVGALSLAGVKMMRNQQQLAKLTSQKFEEEYVLSDMKQILNDPKSCKETFSTLDSTESKSKIDHLVQTFMPRDSTQEARLFLFHTYPSAEKIYGNENVRIDSLELSVGPRIKTGNIGELEVTFDRGPLFHSNRLHKEKIQLSLTWAEQGNLESCGVRIKGSQEDPYWKVIESSQTVAITPRTSNSVLIGQPGKQIPPHFAERSTLTKTIRAQTQELKDLRCEKEYKGAIIYERERAKLFICTTSKGWQALNDMTPDLQESKEFVLGHRQIETQVTQALICSVQSAENIPISARCELKSPQDLPVNRPNIDPGTWSLRLSGQAKHNSKCVYKCFF